MSSPLVWRTRACWCIKQLIWMDSETSERADRLEVESVFAELFRGTDEVPLEAEEGWFSLHVRTERSAPLLGKSEGKQVRGAASHTFFGSSTLRIPVQSSFTIWMVKVTLFDRMRGAEGFDPPSLSLFLPNSQEPLHVRPPFIPLTITHLITSE